MRNIMNIDQAQEPDYDSVKIDYVGFVDPYAIEGMVVLKADNGKEFHMRAFSGEVSKNISSFNETEEDSIPSIYKMVEAMGIQSRQGEGNDVFGVYKTTLDAIKSIRKGDGPRFLEFNTYRWREHCGPNYDNHIGYRAEDEFLEWKKKDPIILAENKLLKKEILTHQLIK